MKPAPFAYHAPESVAEAVGVLADHGDEAKPLAGGQSLVPMLALRLARFEHLVDLNRVGALAEVARDDGAVLVGAMTRQAALEHDEHVASVPLLRKAAPLIGHFQIRNRGTVGGSIAHADPASELPAVALALDADLLVAAADRTRVISAAGFFAGNWTTALEPDELLTAVRFPVWESRSGFAVDEVARRHGDFALAGAACGVTCRADGTIQRVAIGLFGLGSTPLRAAAAEAALVGRRGSTQELAETGRLAVQDLEPPDDVHASSRYRQAVGAHVVARALAAALQEASG